METTRPARATCTSRTAVAASPSRYSPMAHPGTRDRWERASIIDALQAWVAQTAAVPRRNDRSGERPAEAGIAQRKWMAEHPRWPSSSCAAAHFGSWSAAVVCALYDDRADPWNSALRDAGAKIRFRRWSDDAARAALAELWVQIGRPPQPSEQRGRDLMTEIRKQACRADPSYARCQPARLARSVRRGLGRDAPGVTRTSRS